MFSEYSTKIGTSVFLSANDCSIKDLQIDTVMECPDVIHYP